MLEGDSTRLGRPGASRCSRSSANACSAPLRAGTGAAAGAAAEAELLRPATATAAATTAAAPDERPAAGPGTAGQSRPPMHRPKPTGWGRLRAPGGTNFAKF